MHVRRFTRGAPIVSRQQRPVSPSPGWPSGSSNHGTPRGIPAFALPSCLPLRLSFFRSFLSWVNKTPQVTQTLVANLSSRSHLAASCRCSRPANAQPPSPWASNDSAAQHHQSRTLTVASVQTVVVLNTNHNPCICRYCTILVWWQTAPYLHGLRRTSRHGFSGIVSITPRCPPSKGNIIIRRATARIVSSGRNSAKIFELIFPIHVVGQPCDRWRSVCLSAP